MEPGLHAVRDALLLGILTNVGLTSLLMGRNTCRRWRNVICDWSLWRNLILPGKPDDCLTKKETIEVLMVAGQEIRDLTVPADYFHTPDDPTREIQALIPGNLKSLTVEYGTSIFPITDRNDCCALTVMRTLSSAPGSLENLFITLPFMHYIGDGRAFRGIMAPESRMPPALNVKQLTVRFGAAEQRFHYGIEVYCNAASQDTLRTIFKYCNKAEKVSMQFHLSSDHLPCTGHTRSLVWREVKMALLEMPNMKSCSIDIKVSPHYGIMQRKVPLLSEHHLLHMPIKSPNVEIVFNQSGCGGIWRWQYSAENI